MSKKINWSLLSANTIDAINNYLWADSVQCKDALGTASAVLNEAMAKKATLIEERAALRDKYVSEGQVLADAIATSTVAYSEALNRAESAIADAEAALDALKQRKSAALNRAYAVIPDSVYDAYITSARKVDVSAYITATVEMLAGFGLTSTEVQTAKLADMLSRWSGGMRKATGKKALEGHKVKEQVKRSFKASMLASLVEYLVWEAKSFRYNEDKTALTLYTGEDKQDKKAE